MEVLKCKHAELKASCLRALLEKTNDHFHICEERLNWVCQIKPQHLLTLKKTFDDKGHDTPAKVKEFAMQVQQNLVFIIKNYKQKMTFLHGGMPTVKETNPFKSPT